VIAACFNTGQIVGIQAGPDIVSPRYAFGSGPQTLAALQGILFEGDGIDRKLGQMRLQDFQVLSNVNQLGNSPNHIFVDDPYIYVVNSFGNTLQVLQKTGDAGTGDAGLPLTTVAEFPFDAGTSPQSIAKLGTNLYIPLFSSNELAAVNVSNPTAPLDAGRISLSDGIDLRSFDGGVTLPRPSGVAVYRGSIYVGLSNLDLSYQPAGPGVLVQLNVSTGAKTAIYLPPGCLNTYWLVTAGDILYVSCGGRATFDSTFHLSAIDSSGVVALTADGGMTSWNSAYDGGGIGPALTRFAVVGDRLYLGDQLGRIFVVQNVDGGFVERRGYNLTTGDFPINACPPDVSGFSLVQDVIAIP
jgi:hypothetical protein